ncbi:MAG TPA: hypothetical protein VD997_08435 [Phycisphaerales bacterium]|nr:hypothetical protein [Phycisphaerales bacterium]
MVSSTRTKDWTRDGCDAAYTVLVAAFGEPTSVSGGFRWSMARPSTGTQVVIELTVPTRTPTSSVVWIFDPDAVGVSTFLSVDVNSPDGLAWLELEVRRLQRS